MNINNFSDSEDKMIFIISYPDDRHALVVKEKLDYVGEKSIMLDFSDFPKLWEASLSLHGDSVLFTINNGEKVIEGSHVKSVWYRRVSNPKESHKKMLDISRYIRNESDRFLKSLSFVLGNALWISNPDAIERASLKPIQLIVAKELGFTVPNTLIGNSQSDTLGFIEKNAEDYIVSKALDTPYIKMNNGGTGKIMMMYTSKIKSQELCNKITMVKNCPVILQQCIGKLFDVRVTVVGASVFSVAIHMNSNDGIVDFRHHSANIEYEKHTLPADLAGKCVLLTKKLGLNFGCIDLAYTKENQYVFFEINPAGQWLASEIRANLPISDALVKMLRCL